MDKKRELEIVSHLSMPFIEIFLVEITSRNPHGHADLEIGMIMEGSVTLFIENEQHVLLKGDIYNKPLPDTFVCKLLSKAAYTCLPDSFPSLQGHRPETYFFAV